MPASHLVIMAKAPRLGRVKTRLARDVGAVTAWAFYRRSLEETARRLGRDPRWTTWLAVTPERDLANPGLWPEGSPRIGQGGGDLGRRMAWVMHILPPGPAVIIGGDIPGIERRHIAAAFKELGCGDVVFGPAEDGGYWLVGLKRRPVILDPFGDVRWSTSHALDDTLANLPAGTRTSFVETLADVDDGADWIALKERSGSGRRRDQRRPAASNAAEPRMHAPG